MLDLRRPPGPRPRHGYPARVHDATLPSRCGVYQDGDAGFVFECAAVFVFDRAGDDA